MKSDKQKALASAAYFYRYCALVSTRNKILLLLKKATGKSKDTFNEYTHKEKIKIGILAKSVLKKVADKKKND